MMPWAQKSIFFSYDFFAESKICHSIITPKVFKLFQKMGSKQHFENLCLFFFFFFFAIVTTEKLGKGPRLSNQISTFILVSQREKSNANANSNLQFKLRIYAGTNNVLYLIFTESGLKDFGWEHLGI